jgi:hypothetical protein
VALNCGAMLRECIRYEALTKILLNSDNLFDFFKYVEVSTFDIASDAFATFKVSPGADPTTAAFTTAKWRCCRIQCFSKFLCPKDLKLLA